MADHKHALPLTFYALSGSPFSWKVWLALEHLGASYDLRILSASAGDLKAADFLILNHRGKVPVINDGGFILRESAAIIDYLSDRYATADKSLWPGEPRARATARRISSEADGYVYPHARKLMLELVMRQEGVPDAAAVEEAKAALSHEFSRIGKEISAPFLMGSVPTAADFALYPLAAILRRIHSRRPEFAVMDVVPEQVLDWMAGIESLAYFSKTLPPHWRAT